jgi:hypothetical protein
MDLVLDLLTAVRALRKHAGVTAAAVVTVALGIGANTAIFSVVNAVLISPLTYPDPGRIVQFQLTSATSRPAAYASIPKFQFWSEQADVFEDVSGYDFAGSHFNLTDGDEPEQVPGLHVTASYFRLFGVPMERGRAFTAQEDAAGAPHVAVLSNRLWTRRYGADPNVVGKQIRIDAEPYAVIGIVGSGKRWPGTVCTIIATCSRCGMGIGRQITLSIML